ncbi:hypothetical protein FDF26_17920 [Clostridium botulinum]|uniref:hypothetical protein n=1 Tax=Clostridium cagae TaxID=2080751 RepID=UPI0013F7BAD6|nr:hypothetical protein [Clostridium botulinum]
MTNEQNELFLKIIKKEEDLQYCYVSDEGKMFPPHYNDNGVIDVIGEEVYKNYLKNKNNPPKKEPTKEELLEKQLLETQAFVAELRYKSILKENGGM